MNKEEMHDRTSVHMAAERALEQEGWSRRYESLAGRSIFSTETIMRETFK